MALKGVDSGQGTIYCRIWSVGGENSTILKNSIIDTNTKNRFYQKV